MIGLGALLVLVWASPAQAEPFSTLLATLFTSVGIGAGLSGILGKLLTSVLMSALSRALAPRAPAGPELLRELQAPSSLPPYRHVYGKCWASGTPVPVRVKGRIIYGCWLLNSRPSAGPFTVLLDKRALTLTGDPYDFAGAGATASNTPFAGLTRIWIGRGDQMGPPDDIVAEAPLLFNATDGWQGRTVLWMALDAGANASRATTWPSAPPEVMVDGYWSKVWDMRDAGQDPDDPDTWEWSANHGLIVLDALRTNPIAPYDLRNLWLETYEWAADVADEAVAVKAGGTIPRYEINGTLGFVAGTEIEDQVQPLMIAGAAEFVRARGQLGMVPGTPQTPTVTLTDMLDGTAPSFRRYAPRSELATAVAAKYMAPDRAYEQADAPAYVIAGAAAEDGGETLIQPDLSLVTDHRQVQRVQKILGMFTRLQRRIDAEFPPAAFNLVAGSWLSLDLPMPYGSWNRTYRVLQIEPKLDLEGEGVAARCQIVAQEISAAVYAWDAATEEQDVEAYSFDGTVAAVQPPQNVIIDMAATHDLIENGTITPRFEIAADRSPSDSVTHYEWQTRLTGEGWGHDASMSAPETAGVPDASFTAFGPVLSQTGTHEFRIRAIGTRGASGWVTVTGLARNFAPTGVAMVAGPGHLVVTGTAPANAAFAGLRVHRSAVGAAFNTASLVLPLGVASPGVAFSVTAGTVGSNVLANGTLSSAASWTTGTGWSIAAGVASHAPGTASALAQACSLTAATGYRWTMTVSARLAGTATMRIVGTATVTGAAVIANGLAFGVMTSPAAPTSAEVYSNAAGDFSVDDLWLVQSQAGMLSQGPGDFWLTPVTLTGTEGLPIGPFTLTIP